MLVYVVVWYDYDNDCLKKSEVSVIGVYSTLEKAKDVANRHNHKGYCDDDRCYGTDVYEVEIDKVGEEIIKEEEDWRGLISMGSVVYSADNI